MSTNATAIAKREEQSTAVILSQEDIQTLVSASIIPKDTPPPVIKMFSRYCHESGLSPFKRQVHLVRRKDKFNIQTGIDGYRSIADRTGRYAGNDDYVFDEGLTEYGHIQAKRGNPATATSTVYKIVGGVRSPFSATARWAEYCPGDGQDFMWRKMPYLMLGKCAEALALRKAFPDELGGVYTDEEMQQAGQAVVVDEPVVNGVNTRTGEIIDDPPQSPPPPVNGGMTEFDPSTETLTFGKHAGTPWSELPESYLNFLSKNATRTEIKAKADATIRWHELQQINQAQMGDAFEGIFEEPKPAQSEQHTYDALCQSLDIAIASKSTDALVKWTTTNKTLIDSLSDDHRKSLREKFTAGRQALNGTKGAK